MSLAKRSFVILGVPLLTGCLYGTCLQGPCSLERERIIRSYKPKGYYWVKDDMTDEMRLADIYACGGGRGLGVGFTPAQMESERREGEVSDAFVYFRLKAVWDQCMKTKGYRYQR